MLLPVAAEPRELRSYQSEAIDRLRDSLRTGHRRPMLQAPTGAGKTLVASTLVRMALAKGKRVCFTVPSLSLIDQTIEAFSKEGIDGIGVMQANNSLTDESQPVQIASIQTLLRRKLPEVDMVIVDEAHVVFEFYGKWFTDPAWIRTPFIGLSATPWTKGLGKLYDDLLVLATTEELIDRGYLSSFRVFAPSHPDLKGVRTHAGDYHEGDLSKAMDKGALVADVVKTWQERAEGRPTLLFAVDRAHAKHLQQKFEAVGIPCGYQDMNTDPSERREIREKFHSGEYKVVANVDTLTVGVDWDVRCISLVRPTKSIMKFVQIIGRGLRTAPGKNEAGGLLILDHSDNHIRLGFVTDISRDHLDDGREKARAEASVPLPKECPKCHYLRPPRVSVCPACGFKPEPKPQLEHAKGELVELRPRAQQQGPKPSKKVKNGRIELRGGVTIPLGQFYAELMSYGQTHGYKPGWSSQKYRETVGVWPNAHRHVEPMPPCFEVLSFIKSMQIKYAKRRAF